MSEGLIPAGFQNRIDISSIYKAGTDFCMYTVSACVCVCVYVCVCVCACVYVFVYVHVIFSLVAVFVPVQR
jgi:hypothetical protein